MAKEKSISLFGSPSHLPQANAEEPSKEPVMPSKWRETGRKIGAETLLSILYFANGKTIHLPKMSAARRLIRNENMLKDYKNGVVYTELAQKYGISERWVRELCKSLLNKE